jgi:Gly-Xaa carboxypeptidase
MENLIQQGFKPTRSILITSGFDEECSGRRGARKIVKYLLEQYGSDSVAMVIDEGGGFGPQYGTQVAMPNIGEKGYMDIQVSVQTPGGHSSVPPRHTSIGILADLIATIENSPFKPRLTKASSIYDTVNCIAEHAPDTFSSKLKNAIKKDSLKKVVDLLLDEQPSFLPLLRTTTAVDRISGGVKANALPEGANAIINHRIAVDSSIGDIEDYYKKLLSPAADKFNLSFSAFGKDLSTGQNPTASNRILTVNDAYGYATQPVPKAPTFGSPAWDVLAGTIVSSFQAFRKNEFEKRKDENGILVVPSMSTGNTDVRYYGDLTKNIYRYVHKNSGGSSRLSNVHTVNESMNAKSFVEMIGFFTTLVLNMDEAMGL